MRAEGVLRVILNASLYVGMPCLEDGKHVRTTVFEDRERTSLTIRVSSYPAPVFPLTIDCESEDCVRACFGNP